MRRLTGCDVGPALTKPTTAKGNGGKVTENPDQIKAERDHYKAALEKILVREPAGHYRYSTMGMVGIAAKALRKGEK
jgi:hypothetical protein